MKKISALLFTLLLSASMLSFAQTTSTESPSGAAQDSTAPRRGPAGDRMGGQMGGHMMDPQMMVNHLDQQLKLTSEQKTQITTIVENSNKQAEALRSNGNDRQANREAMRQLHENTHAQIRAVLTPDQQTKFDSMMKNMRGDRDHDQQNSTTQNPK